MPKIVVKNKAEIVMEYIMGDHNVSIGREEDNDISLEDEAVSEDHCIIKQVAGKLEVEDLDTAFGTRVNNNPIRSSELSVGDVISVGEHSLSIRATENDILDAEDGEHHFPVEEYAYLLCIQGNMEGRKFEISTVEETKIGRSKDFNDIWISKEIDKSVSRRHATIMLEDGTYYLTDKRSKNRSFLNKHEVEPEDKLALEEGDEILIGKNIFRFVLTKEDWSSAKKAGVIWLRLFPLLKKVGLYIVLAGGIGLIIVGLMGLSIINSRPDSTSIRPRSGYLSGFSGAPGGFLKNDILDITPSPAIGDVTGNGANEVVAVSSNGNVYCWSGATGDLLWRESIGRSALTSPSLADINGNGVLDIIVGSDDSRVYVLDGQSGQLLYRSPFIGGRLLDSSSPLVADITGDGLNDIVVVTDANIVAILYATASGYRDPIDFRVPDPIMTSPVLLRRANGERRVAVATNGGELYFFRGDDPDSRQVINVTQQINVQKGINLVLNEIASAPAVGDMTGDGSDDLAFTTGAYYIGVISGDNLSLVWSEFMQPFSTLASPDRYASPVLADITGNGTYDVFTGWANGKLYAFNGRSGAPLWEENTDHSNRIISGAALADFSKNGILEALIAGEDGRLMILDLRPDVRNRVLVTAEVRGKVTSAPVIGDITGDGNLDVVITTVADDIYLYTTQTAGFKNNISWPSFRGGSDNSASGFLEDLSPFYKNLTAGGGILIFAGVVILLLTTKKKKASRPQIKDGRSQK